MSYILDTCVLSETIKPNPDTGCIKWLRQQKADHLFISTFSLGELRRGIDRLAAGEKQHQLLIWFAKLCDSYTNRFLDFDKESAQVWGSLCATLEKDGHPMPTMDSLIAASALRFGLTLVTRNQKDYQHSPVPLLNPWS
ncbi:MAG: type II toxin-antitoxin system VapC family toxin [Spirochaetes bacterium]|nr:type II toxin-antitoxin system VapC family toxin [Spirochaetota bacterium]MBU0956725.1 type II toxin-antitoxin system VapC family toxin [Spirochaetota bacterium]